MNKQLIEAAKQAWGNYGQAINKHFKLDGFLLEFGPLETALNSKDDKTITDFINYVKGRTQELEESE